MNQCTKCGALLPEQTIVCPNCQTPVQAGMNFGYQGQMPYQTGSDQGYQGQMPYQTGSDQGYQGQMPYQPVGNQGYQGQMPYQPGFGTQQNPYFNNPMYANGGYGAQPQSQKKNGGKLAFIIIGIVVLIILVIAGVLAYRVWSDSRPKDYEVAVRRYLDGIQAKDVQMMLTAYPPEVADKLRDNGWNEMAEDTFEEVYGSLEEAYGYSFTMTYKLSDAEARDASEIAYLEEALQYYYDYECTIAEAYEIEVILIMSHGASSLEFTQTVITFQTNGEWYIFG